MGPQCEDGYTRIANELLEALCRTRISGESMQIFWTILRKTYGFGKKVDVISLSQFVAATGMKKPAVVRALRNLHGMSFIIKIDKGKSVSYGINKHHEEWEPLSKRKTTFQPESKLKKYCYICNFDKALEKHHITPRCEGGSNKAENLIVLCPNCHALVHQKEFSRETLIIKKANVESVIKEDNVLLTDSLEPLSKTVHTKERGTKEKKEKNLPSSADEAHAGDEGEEFITTRKKRKLTGKRLTSFLQFWDAFDYKVGRAESADSWLDIPTLTDKIVAQIVEAAQREARARPELRRSGKTPKMAQGWLSGRRWEDDPNAVAVTQAKGIDQNGKDDKYWKKQEEAAKFFKERGVLE